MLKAGSDTVSDTAGPEMEEVVGLGAKRVSSLPIQSTAILETFFLAMTLYPDVLEKARESIDQAIGTDRLVDNTDQEALPYITCVFREVLR